MRGFLVVGAKGRGKSTTVKSIISKFPKERLMIFDPNNEYSDYGAKAPPTMPEFLAEAVEARGKVIVIEEATIFFRSHASSEDLLNILVRMRHTKNAVIFVFHSLRAVPVSILEMIDFVFLMYTNDREDIMRRKFWGMEIYDQWRHVQRKAGHVRGTPEYHVQSSFKNIV